MDFTDLDSNATKCVNLRLCSVSGCMTEILEIRADRPSFHVVFVPGNPGVITFYKEFVESLFKSLGGMASVSAVGASGHTEKIEFIKVQNIEAPLVLVGHSIGSYIALEMLRRLPEKAMYCIGLYPFLALNLQSKKQAVIVKVIMSRVLSTMVTLFVASLSLLPRQVLRLISELSNGKSWSNTAHEACCSHLPQYHTIRNVLYMARTEFIKLSETPDWEFMRENQEKISFLYGIDDHWGPLQMFEEVESNSLFLKSCISGSDPQNPLLLENRKRPSTRDGASDRKVVITVTIKNMVSRQASGIALSIEREGHTHGFCCTEAGSIWVARHVASLIKNKLAR
ncbi:hypothetical protein GOBAR_DD08120 [Gossypium barbadense]|nr:hypothetical protein GOBAR_DD08120 [Gossypium barbadense]